MGFFKNIKESISGHGHTCICDDCMEEHHHHHHGFDTVMVWRVAIAIVFFVAGGILERFSSGGALILRICSILCAGYDLFIGAVANIFRKHIFDECLLMSIVAIAAVIIGEASEGATVIILFQLGEMFQGYAVAKVRHNIEGLMENRSPEASAVLADVRSDKGEKGRTEEFITHFARIYTPVVLCIALVIAVISPAFLGTTIKEGIYRALVMMVIACPCAIVISVPLSYFAGIGGATRKGILFKSTNAVDAVAQASSVVFDKTGALQAEHMRVLSIKSDRMDADVFMRVAAHACAFADDVYSESIKAAYTGTIYIELIQSFQLEKDRGITVEVDDVKIVLGLEEFVREHGIDPGDDRVDEPCAYLAINGQYAGRIIFGSEAKPGVAEAVTVLSWDRQVTMITDDSPAASEKFARQIGIDNFYTAGHPGEKVAVVRDIRNKQMKRGNLLFVGNAEMDDACIREADVGISLHGADSDAAIEAADVVIMDGSPAKVVTALQAAKHIRGIVWQNILFALLFKAIILILDMFGTCPLWLAVFADVGVTLLAVLNSLRAFFFRETE